MRRFVALSLALLVLAVAAPAQRLLVGLEDSSLPLKSTDLAGFPAVGWTSHPAMEVNGMAADEAGNIYVCNGPFTTRLYSYDPDDGSQNLLCTVSVDIHGLAIANGVIYGFANFASPMGLYTINFASGQASLAVDLSASGYRYFGLDFNPGDGLLYGYTEYGSPAGLHSIDPQGGVITPVAGPIPADNSQGRGLAVGEGVIYLTATRGDDGIALYAWDLAAGGPWTPFTQPYPANHNTGGAAWLPDLSARCEVTPAELDLGVLLAGGARSASFTVTNAGTGSLTGEATADCPGISLDNAVYSLEAGESQDVQVLFSASQAGELDCIIDPGAGCEALPCHASVVQPSPMTGEDSACGVVENLGHLPGAFSGFMVDWNAGDVGLQLANGAGNPVIVTLWVDDEQAWSGVVSAEEWAASSAGVDPAALGQDVVVHLEVADGVDTWNEGGSECAWDLAFADLPHPPRPLAFRLSAPAPNPFNPSTTLTLALPMPENVRLTVVDLGGRTVAVLHAGSLSAGSHSFSWQPTETGSGLYFVVAEGAGRRDVRRLLLVR